MFLLLLSLGAVMPAAAALLPQKNKNIVFVLADDLNADWKSDRLSYMPNLKQFFKEGGTEFVNHVAAVPVCGPSRSSFLLGRYPHNTRYLCNDDHDSVQAFVKEHNNTIGRWLRDAGYHSAFLGKYVNSVNSYVPYGWSHWGGFMSTYDFYNASRYDMDWSDNPQAAEPEKKIVVMEGEHQADFLPRLVLDNVRKAQAKGKPFFIHTTPVMPHWGTCYGPQFPAGETYNNTDPHWEFNLIPGVPGGPSQGKYVMPISPCPTVRNAHKFDGHTNPHIEGSYNTSNTGPRPLVRQQQEAKPLDAYEAEREDIGFRNRSASLIDLDEMLGAIMHGLQAAGVENDTYVIFSSDNGYHLGEHRMAFGKGQPYETDVRLPMYIRGPGVRRGATLPLPTTHLDITRTIVELAGADAHSPIDQMDGKSFAPQLLAGEHWGTVEDWRNFSFSEFFCDASTWQYVRMIDQSTGGDNVTTFARWCEDNVTEVYDISPGGPDPWQMHNLVGAPGSSGAFAAEIEAVAAPMALALGQCSGEQACSAPETAAAATAMAAISAPLPTLQCYSTVTTKNQYLGSWSFLPLGGQGKKATQLHGWAVDRTLDGQPGGKPRGFSPVVVRLRVDGKWLGSPAAVVANVTRPDLADNPKVPNLEHGFVMDISDVPPQALHGKHQFDIVGVKLNAAGQATSQHPISSSTPFIRCLCDGIECTC